MGTLKSILDSLPPSKREQLMAAFEHSFAQIVPVDDKKGLDTLFIGVHTGTIPNFHPIQTVGVWAVGTLSVPKEFKRT